MKSSLLSPHHRGNLKKGLHSRIIDNCIRMKSQETSDLQMTSFVVTSPIEAHLRGPIKISCGSYTGIRHLRQFRYTHICARDLSSLGLVNSYETGWSQIHE